MANTLLTSRLRYLLARSADLDLKYTLDELRLLRDIIDYRVNPNGPRDRFEFFMELEYYIQDGFIKIYDEIEEPYPLTLWEYYLIVRHLTLGQYMLLYHRRMYIFLMCVPLEDTPKYLNNKDMVLFAERRLKINK